MNLEVCLHNITKFGKKSAVANWPSDVVSRIHVYGDPWGFRGSKNFVYL